MKIGDKIQYRGATIQFQYVGAKGFEFGWVFNDACGDETGRYGMGTTIDDCKGQIDDYLEEAFL